MNMKTLMWNLRSSTRQTMVVGRNTRSVFVEGRGPHNLKRSDCNENDYNISSTKWSQREPLIISKAWVNKTKKKV